MTHMLGLVQMNDLHKGVQEVKCHMQKSSGHSQGLPGMGYRHGHKRVQIPGAPRNCFISRAKRGVPHRWRNRGFHLTSVEDDVTKRGDKRVGVCVHCTGLSKDVPHQASKGCLIQGPIGGEGPQTEASVKVIHEKSSIKHTLENDIHEQSNIQHPLEDVIH